MRKFTLEIADALLYDRLHTLFAEYDISIEWLAELAVKRLLDDVELVRNLHAGRIHLE